MVTIQYAGRLGNNLFQYSAAHIFANKFNLTLNTNPPENNFGLSKLNGLINDGKTIIVDDDNFMELLSSDKIDSAHYHFTGYFQLKDFILGYHEEIKKLFNLKYRDGLIDEVFVIYRIGDINGGSTVTIGNIDSSTCTYYYTITGLTVSDIVNFYTSFTCGISVSVVDCPSSVSGCFDDHTYGGPTTVYVCVDGSNCC